MNKIVVAWIVLCSVLLSGSGYKNTLNSNVYNYTYQTNDITAMLERKLSDVVTLNFNWLEQYMKDNSISASSSEARDLMRLKEYKLGDCSLVEAANVTGQWWRAKGLQNDYSQTKKASCDLFNPPQEIRQDCTGYIYLTLAFYLNKEHAINLANNGVTTNDVASMNIWDKISKVPSVKDKLQKCDIRTFSELEVGDITVQPYWHAMIVTDKKESNFIKYDESESAWPGSTRQYCEVDGYLWPKSKATILAITNRNTRCEYRASGNRADSPIQYVIRTIAQ